MDKIAHREACIAEVMKDFIHEVLPMLPECYQGPAFEKMLDAFETYLGWHYSYCEPLKGYNGQVDAVLERIEDDEKAADELALYLIHRDTNNG